MPEFGLSLCFKVVIDGQPLGNWSKCEGLAVEYDIYEYREGGNNSFVHRIPGRAKYQNIRLTRPVDPSSAVVAAWLASVAAMTFAPGVGVVLKGSTATIVLLDSACEPVAIWNLVGVYPAKWTGPTLDVGQNSVAMETLELVHNGFVG